MNKIYTCPCCGEKTLPDIGEFDICNICKWQDDPLQRDDPNDDMGANTQSLNQYQAIWRQQYAANNQDKPPARVARAV